MKNYRDKEMDNQENNLSKIMAIHAELLKENPYCYFELAYTRYTDWMVWICTNSRDHDPNRKVLLCGQGSTQEEACADGLAKYEAEQVDASE